jgi:cation diffusion facilitator CzcD-associated flavoprotein CzcO
MYTLGYNFKPWTADNAIADAPIILDYLRETVDEYQLADKIVYDSKLIAADWSDATARWTVTLAHGDGSTSTRRANFLFLCTGYYSYNGGYRPEFPGEAEFAGPIVHPQFWPEDLDYAGKNVVVIGSGATAVTLVPSMAKTAGHVTMLQRSPTYIVSRPAKDKWALRLRKYLPSKLAYMLTRWKNVSMQLLIFNLSRKRPDGVRKNLLKMVRDEMGEHVDMRHFTPSYNPWDQRLCLVPDSDMFNAIKSGKASITTDHIDRFVSDGILLKSGEKLSADIIVSATGLKLAVGGEAQYSLNGVPFQFSQAFNYKGVMFSNIPNLALTSGYTNASWTLKADLTSEYICRLINTMDAKQADIAFPRLADPQSMTPRPLLDFNSGYVVRALADLPKQGEEKPWRLAQNYALDIMTLRHGAIEDGVMTFAKAGGASISADLDDILLEAAE